MSRFYLTTAIDYVNSRPHLGTAYEKITADVIARYKRLTGVETRFLMGNDEHSHNVYQRARDEGVDPLVYCDRMEIAFRDVWTRLDISYDDFIRTTQPRHRAGVTAFVQRMAEAGDLYEGAYEGWYCRGCEAFKQEKDLADGICPVHRTTPQWIKEKNHFFRLAKYQQPLLDHYAAHPEFLRPDSRRNEILRFLEAGPEDISISRMGQSWGIPFPANPDSVVYVWADALINYISAVGFGSDEDLCGTWWPADLHVIGKDITRFHCVIWPAMLLSAGLELPRQVFGHGWIQTQGQKMSKSGGAAVDPLDAADRLGPDPLRLYLTKEITYGSDGDFSWERFENRYNVDLANNLGNLVSRLTSMAHRYRDGRLVRSAAGPGVLASRADAAITTYRDAMERLAIHEGAAAAFALVDATNEFIAEVQPWVTAKDPADADRLDQQLFDISEALRISAILLTPVMPQSCAEIRRRLGDDRAAGDLRLERDAAWNPTAEREIAKGDPLWPRLDSQKERQPMDDPKPTDIVTQAPPATPAGTPTSATHSPETLPRISIDDFFKVELRVGRVVSAEAVPKSRKLIRLELDTGGETRQILAGILGAYEPESLVGRLVVFVSNLKPAKLAGFQSDGMVLAASGDDNVPVLLSVDDPERVQPGFKVS